VTEGNTNILRRDTKSPVLGWNPKRLRNVKSLGRTLRSVVTCKDIKAVKTFGGSGYKAPHILGNYWEVQGIFFSSLPNQRWGEPNVLFGAVSPEVK
jgi:hypothetical protein